jgi:hypothetical protein
MYLYLFRLQVLLLCFMLVSWLPYSSTLKKEAKYSFETSVDFHRTTLLYPGRYNLRYMEYAVSVCEGRERSLTLLSHQYIPHAPSICTEPRHNVARLYTCNVAQELYLQCRHQHLKAAGRFHRSMEGSRVVAWHTRFVPLYSPHSWEKS